MAETPLFVDISSFQGIIDFQAYAAWSKQWDGISRIALKSTEGVGFTDPFFHANRAGALNAGIDRIFYYHFGRPDLGNTATAEANYMHSVVGTVRESDLIILDLEVQALATEAWAHVWLFQQEQNYGGKLPGIYASSSYVESNLQYEPLNRYQLWLANWQFTPDERPPAPSPWTSYIAVQYTDKAVNIPGIQGPVDANIFLGGGNTPVQEYSPNSADFNNWFTVDANGNWACKATNAVIMGGNKALFSQLSIDGNTLPVIGLPLENEQYIEPNHSIQRFERGIIDYNAADPNDTQPGISGTSHLAFIDYAAINGYAKAQTDLATAQAQITALQAQIDPNPVVQDVKNAFAALDKLKADVS